MARELEPPGVEGNRIVLRLQAGGPAQDRMASVGGHHKVRVQRPFSTLALGTSARPVTDAGDAAAVEH
ncbi:hypothetical protein D9M72_479100 [compost metagenome]